MNGMSSTPLHHQPDTTTGTDDDEMTGADVVDLAAARSRYATPDTDDDTSDGTSDTGPDTGPDDEADTDPDTDDDGDTDDDADIDHESLLIERGAPGAPVGPGR
jgi:hypothetical protein